MIHRLYGARALRAFADGYAALLLPVWLLHLGYTSFEFGVLATVALLGSGVLTLLVGYGAHRYGVGTLLVAAALLMAATGFGFAACTAFWPLLLVGFIGTLNPSAGGVSVFVPLEHTALAHVAQDAQRTHVFARYSLVGSLSAATGALLVGLPQGLTQTLHVDPTHAFQAMFVGYGVIGLVAAVLYRGLPLGTEQTRPARPLRESRAMVYRLAGLFALDSFAGGLVLDSLMVLWLHDRFALQPAVAGAIFFWIGLLSSFSYLVAVRIARRIGLVNTMVFTHIPASMFLMLVPFAPTLEVAVALLLLRSALSQMDVPTRTSYVMAIVPPAERPAAASVTSVPRSFAAAAAPVIAGSFLAASDFGWPLIVAGGLKIAYDLALLYTCRHVKPPEER